MKSSILSSVSACGVLAAGALLILTPASMAKDKPRSKGKATATPAPVAVAPAEPANTAPLPPSPVTTVTTRTPDVPPDVQVIRGPSIPAPRNDSPSGIQQGTEPIVVPRVPAVPSSVGAVNPIPDSGGVIRSTGAGSGDASTRISPGAATGVPSASGTASGIGSATTNDIPGGTGPNPSPAGTAVPGAPKASGAQPVLNPGTRPIK